MQDGSWSSPAWKHESLKRCSFKHRINIHGFQDEFTEIIKRRCCKTAAREKKKNRTFDRVLSEAKHGVYLARRDVLDSG